MRHRLALAVTLFAACTRAPGPATKEGRLSPLLSQLGKLQFPVSAKSPEAQRFTNQGLTLIYGFNHAEALRSFQEAARVDPPLAMAYWGQALALAPNINDPAIGPDRETQGAAAIAEAVKRRASATEKEQALIDALAARFSNAAKPDRAALNNAYAAAMTKVYARFSADPDVATLYADAVMNTMPWNYWTIERKPKDGIGEARAALEKAIKEFPDHPGAHHTYIHLIEASDDVDLAVPSAEKLGALVPGAGHLVHMPSHIFIRVGRYADAEEANRKAILADEGYIAQCKAQGIYPAGYYPHNIHFLNAALAMEGRAADAIAAARKVASQHDHAMLKEPGFAFAHVLKATPVLTLVRFGRWPEILAEPEPPSDQIFGRAMWRFARGFAAKDKAPELAALRKLAADPSLPAMKVLEVNSLAQLAAVGVAMLEGEVARSQGKGGAAIEALRRAVKLEDALLYSEPPDWMLPPRQYLGAALLEAGRAKEAERIYREDLRRHRANGWSLMGLSRALEAQQKDAAEVRAQFTKAWTRADVALTASRF